MSAYVDTLGNANLLRMFIEKNLFLILIGRLRLFVTNFMQTVLSLTLKVRALL